MKVKKVLKIMSKKYGWQGNVSKEQEIFAQTVVNATLEAINYTRCCTELSKRPNTSSTWECFSKEDKQKKGNV